MATEKQATHIHCEEAWIIRARAGDRAAFKQLYETHLSMVYGLALRLANNTSSAEEITQETFIRVWHSLKNFDGNSRFSSWLHRVTSNTAIDYLRKQRTWLQVVFDKDEVINNIEELRDQSLADDLDKLITRLPERARLVFVLHAIEGYRHEEIAELTHMAVGSSKAQLNRAKILLREWMQDD